MGRSAMGSPAGRPQPPPSINSNSPSRSRILSLRLVDMCDSGAIVVRSRVYAQTVLAQRALAIFFAICLPLWRFCCLTHFPFGSILGRMILVTGADNRLGYEVCRRLRAKGQRVRAWVPRAMPPNRIERLRATGVEFFPAELHNPAALVAACRDVEAVISTDAAMLPIDPSETFDRECARSLRDFTHILGGLQFICVTVPRRFRTKSVLVEEREEYRSEEDTTEHQSPCNIVCRLLLVKKPERHLVGNAHRIEPLASRLRGLSAVV